LSEGDGDGQGGTLSYVQSLESKLQCVFVPLHSPWIKVNIPSLPSVLLRSSEARIGILANQIAQVSADTTLSDALVSESAARTALADAQRRLESYEKILGPDPSVGEDLARMAKQLEEKHEALRVMDLKVKENEAVSQPSPFLSGKVANVG
jgi:hypothetical protein